MPMQVAVESGLENVSQALQNAGFNVVNLENSKMQNVQCIVVSGVDDNVLGIETAQTKAPVINAQGLTAQEVVKQVQRFQ
ncbi:MAG: YkuS family protein [Bacillota bacterium]